MTPDHPNCEHTFIPISAAVRMQTKDVPISRSSGHLGGSFSIGKLNPALAIQILAFCGAIERNQG